MNLLVLCTGNSARSIMLESILNHFSDGRVTAYSAGSSPSGTVHPVALKLLKKRGYPTKGLRSKSWDEFALPDAPKMDAVITVCGNARDEVCPVWPGTPLKGHWGIADPAAITRSEKATKAAFEVAFTVLKARAKAWLSLEFEDMDDHTQKQFIDRIAEISLVM